MAGNNDNKGGMTYYAKDCLFLFFIGLIPSLLVKGGVFAWALICLVKYLCAKSEWDEVEKNICRTKADFEARGIKIDDRFFDENGNYIPPKY